ncbi:WD40 repeat domain-containing protein [Actinoplanes sp. NPDC020271]|uniref:WD40 repeat domain-containing protein n=1 Tax=Actinoplanes sp. NPDC020271 TaxID=3363896 RepID=UPI0037A84268
MFVVAAGSPERPLVVACEGPVLEVIDPGTVTRLCTLPTGIDHALRLVAADLDGRPGAIVTGASVRRAIDLETGAWTSITQNQDQDQDSLVRATLPPYTVELADTVLTVRDRATGEPVGVPVALPNRWARGAAVTTIDGRPVVAVASGTTVTVHDLTTTEEILTVVADEQRVDAVAILGNILVTAGIDESVRLWDLRSGASLGTPAPSATGVPITAVATGRLHGLPFVISGDEAGTLRLWDLGPDGLTQAGTTLHGHDDWVRSIRITELDGRAVAVSAADRTLRRWDLTTGEIVGDPIDTRYSTDVFTIAHWNGMTVGIGKQSDNRTRVWDLTTGELVAGPLDDWAASCAFAALDGTLYAVLEDHPEDGYGDYDQDEIALQVWDLAEGDKLGEPLVGGGFGGIVMRKPVTVTAVGGRPTLVSGSGVDGLLRLREFGAENPVDVALAGHEGQVNALATAELDGRTVAVTGGLDGTVRFWDLSAATAIGGPRIGHIGKVRAAALAEVDGMLVAVTGGSDGDLRTWPL